jgi:membrane fusion protein (multidrug efflux system)
MTPRRLSPRFRRLGIVAAVLLVVLLLGSGVYLRIAGNSEADAAETDAAGGPVPDAAAAAFAADVAIPVEGATVVRDTLVISVTAAAEAASWQQTLITAQVQGRVAAIAVRENDAVAAGTPLLQIDAAEYQLAVSTAQASLRSAEANYQELMLGNEDIPDAQLREDRARNARARSGLDAAEVALERAQLDLSRTRVTAPFAGRVASIKVVPGQWVGAGVELMTVLDLDPIKVEVQVLEGEIGYISTGSSASVVFSAFPNEVFRGRVATINPVVERAPSRAARVTVLVPNPQGRILPGMYAKVAVEARKYANRVMVPRSAVLERDRTREGNGAMVFVYEGDDRGGLAKWRYVTTGMANDSMIEILTQGIETDSVRPGERVLTDGHYTLTHDARVRLVENAQQEGGRPE